MCIGSEKRVVSIHTRVWLSSALTADPDFEQVLELYDKVRGLDIHSASPYLQDCKIFLFTFLTLRRFLLLQISSSLKHYGGWLKFWVHPEGI